MHRSPSVRVTIFVPMTLRESFNKRLAREGINQSTFLVFSTYQWVKEMEQKIREGKVQKVPTRYVRRKTKEPKVEIQVAMSETLKKRLDYCLQFIPDTLNELWVKWIMEFVNNKRGSLGRVQDFRRA